MTAFYDSTEFLSQDYGKEEDENKQAKLNEFARLSTPKPIMHLGSTTEVINVNVTTQF